TFASERDKYAAKTPAAGRLRPGRYPALKAGLSDRGDADWASAVPTPANARRLNHSYRFHSITSSAVASSDWGMARPSAFAVFILMMSSYLFGACTGMSAGFSPLRMRST